MASPRPIGPWEPATHDGALAFVRRPAGPFGDGWAPRAVVPARAGGRRVVWLGESAAAGYLLAPTVTPARALGARLGPSVDMVDLAHTNARLDTLLDAADAARQLDPDAYVVFWGNNATLLETPTLSPLFPDPEARRLIAAALTEGLAGPARLAAAALRDAIDTAFAALAGLGRPLWVVVPEANLVDWEDRQPVPWLPGDGVARWYALAARARAALRQGDAAAAREAARAMLALDGGAAPTGFALLTRAARALGLAEEAEVAARAAADSTRYPWLLTPAAPRATDTVQRVIVDACARHGIPTLALGDVVPPDRRGYLDYCHLTAAGIDALAAAVAERVAPALGVSPACAPLAVPVDVAVAACVGGALHGARRLLPVAPTDVLAHWCREALAIDEARAADAIRAAVATRAAPVPAVMTPWQGAPHGLTPAHGWRSDHLDAAFVAAARAALGAAAIDPLLGPPRIEPWWPHERPFPDLERHADVPRHAAWRVVWPHTRWCIVGPVDGAVEISARTTGATGEGRVCLDGMPAATWTLTPRWTTWSLPVRLGPGLHRLTLDWPMPSVAGEDALAAARARLAEGREALLHPVFGEVWHARLVA